MELLITQQNDLFDLIQKQGLDPKDFHWDKSKQSEYDANQTSTAIQITYKETGFFFRFDQDGSRNRLNYCVYSPGAKQFKDTVGANEWELRKNVFFDWLKFLRREISVENKWEAAFDSFEQFKESEFQSESRFTENEYKLLIEKIELLQERIQHLELLPDQIQALQDGLESLKSEGKGLSKLNWWNLFVGLIINTGARFAITKENWQKLVELAENVFEDYLIPTIKELM